MLPGESSVRKKDRKNEGKQDRKQRLKVDSNQRSGILSSAEEQNQNQNQDQDLAVNCCRSCRFGVWRVDEEEVGVEAGVGGG